MNSSSLLILTIYLLCLAYIFQRMIQDLAQLFTIELNQKSLNAQLKAQKLKESIEINFEIADRYKFDQLRKLSIGIINKSNSQSFYIDWEQSTLADFTGRSRRVVRLIPGMIIDLSQPQVFSVIAPYQTLKEELTVEDTLISREGEFLEIGSPLFKPEDLKEAFQGGDKFTLRLILRLVNPSFRKNEYLYVLSCEFKIKKIPWKRAIYWQALNNI